MVQVQAGTHLAVLSSKTRKGGATFLDCEERDLLDGILPANFNTILHAQFFLHHVSNNVAVVVPFTQWAKARQREFPDVAVRLSEWPNLHQPGVEHQTVLLLLGM